MPYIEEAILKAVGESELSERQISIEAVGHESAIRSLKRGVSPNAATIAALCAVLDLEIYIGPYRAGPPPDEATGLASGGASLRGASVWPGGFLMELATFFNGLPEECPLERPGRSCTLLEAFRKMRREKG